MNRKITATILDIIFLVIIFRITDYLMLEVFQTDSIWYELGIYIVPFGVFFGPKAVVSYMRKKKDK